MSCELDARQGGGRNRFGEPVDDSFPCVEQMLMWAYDVDLQLADIADGEAVHLDQCSEVVEALRSMVDSVPTDAPSTMFRLMLDSCVG